MPLNAYGVLATFMAAGTVIGSAIAWLVGPRRWTAAILPVLAAITSLGTLGHRLRIGFGPTVPLFGFEVHLFSDLGFAALFALAAALAQRSVLAGWRARLAPGRDDTLAG
jgi:hypothetical protein